MADLQIVITLKPKQAFDDYLGEAEIVCNLVRSLRFVCGFVRRGLFMEFPTEIVGDKGYIHITSDLDTEVAGEALRSAFNQIYDQGKRTIVLDLSGAQIINSYGIGKVLSCYQKLKAERGVLMVKPLDGFVKETFELLMLDKLLPVEK